jgi:hypothetical protein
MKAKILLLALFSNGKWDINFGERAELLQIDIALADLISWNVTEFKRFCVFAKKTRL